MIHHAANRRSQSFPASIVQGTPESTPNLSAQLSDEVTKLRDQLKQAQQTRESREHALVSRLAHSATEHDTISQFLHDQKRIVDENLRLRQRVQREIDRIEALKRTRSQQEIVMEAEEERYSIASSPTSCHRAAARS